VTGGIFSLERYRIGLATAMAARRGCRDPAMLVKDGDIIAARCA
jgi:hypothetical protein